MGRVGTTTVDGPAIAVDGLVKHYGPVRAVDGVSFAVRPGEVFGLLGPNGAGKTTTVEILEGYRRPDGGTVRVLGLDPSRDGRRLRARIGVMLQEGGLAPGLTPTEQLRCLAAFYETPHDPDVLIDRLGLRGRARVPIRRLSGGEAQRVSLACALVGRPAVAFLDEPTAGMDPHARLTTWELVRDLAASGTTVLLTTHAMDEAEQLCDRIAILAGGHVAAIGAPGELTRAGAGEEVVFAASGPLDVAELAAALGVDVARVARTRTGEYRVRAAADPALVAALALHLRDRGATLTEFRAGRRSLQDVFLRVTAEAGPAPATADEP
ncbi:MAG: ABC transporter ATP-binding protein [Acidimicrobiia bacterium]|nr:MAG: ABC transporter ATP-binding protein [Acidimicrobiia bacterium]